MMSGDAQELKVELGRKLGVDSGYIKFLDKPFTLGELSGVVVE